MAVRAPDYERGNRIAAEIILSDPEKHVGVQLEWAQLWAASHPLSNNELLDSASVEIPQIATVTEKPHSQPSLFSEEAA